MLARRESTAGRGASLLRSAERVAELREAAQILQTEMIKISAQEVHDETLQNIVNRLELSEARAISAEERLKTVEETLAAQQAESRSRSLQSAALVSMTQSANSSRDQAKAAGDAAASEEAARPSRMSAELAALHRRWRLRPA